KAQEKLIHAQKVEAVGRLASGVAHDFGNLMSLILGYTSRARRLHEPEELQQAVTGVESAARRAVLVVRKLLSFSRQDETLLQVFDPAEALRELRPMLRQLFPPEIELQLQVPASLPSIRFDRTQFELMALNIASNAQQAMPEGGRFALSATARAEGGIALEFSDNGAGMPAEVQARVFEPFFTTKPSGEGTGLGLAVVHDLVTAAAGTLDVRSTPGIGTTFRIELAAA
ncbi:MAG: ATP-binding protein, partial [Pseudoxanthomonas sp.]